MKLKTQAFFALVLLLLVIISLPAKFNFLARAGNASTATNQLAAQASAHPEGPEGPEGIAPSGLSLQTTDTTKTWLAPSATTPKEINAPLAGCSTPTFNNGPNSPITVGDNPHYVALGYLNADTHIDMVTTNYDAGTISILLGNGTGSFTVTGPAITVGTQPVTAEIGDYNNDTKQDLAVTNQISNNMHILLGNGDGTFSNASGSPITVGSSPRAVVKGYFNGDNNLDLAVSNGGSNNLSILLGNGNGTFSPASGSPLAGGGAPFQTVVAKFNNDNHFDLAVANIGEGTVRIYLGDGNGGFTQFGSAISSGQFTSYIALGHFNADANIDMAVTNRVSNNMIILLGNGNGGFSQPSGSPYSVGAAPMGVAVGDLNLDGKQDIAVSNENSANTTVRLGNGDGTFGQSYLLTKGRLPTHIAVADLNEDNKPDVATPDGGDDTITVLLNGCSGCMPFTISPNSIAAGTVGTAYTNQNFTVSGGIAPYNVSLTGALPTGMSFANATLSGTPSQPGSFPITINATDFYGCSGSRNYTLTVNCQAIDVGPTNIATGVVNSFYSQTFSQTGGIGAVTFSLMGALPSGLSLADNVLSGTPTQSGSFPITVKATDANGCTGMRDYTLVVNCPLITVNPGTISAGVVGNFYTETFSQSGGLGSVTLSVLGTLPTGVTFSGNTLSGVPSQSGSFPITVKATDSFGCTGMSNYTLVINCQTISVGPPSISAGVAGTSYSEMFSQANGVGSVTFSVIGTLPAGLNLVGNTLSGIPTQAGSFPITIKATDSNGCAGMRDYTLQISCQSIAVNPSTATNGFVGSNYSQSFSQTSGIGTITWSHSGTLPNGLALNSQTGVLAGLPTTAGTFAFTIRATDQNGCFGERSYTVIISGSGLQFYPLARPVRLLDTRPGQGNCDNVAAPIAAGTSITTLARTTCESITIPSTAKAVVGNITVINQTAQLGYLTIYPDGQQVPLAANLIYEPGQILANNFTVGLSNDGKFNIFGERTIDVIVDISGYFAPPDTGALFYHPLPKPVRLLDTRSFGNCDNISTPIQTGTSLTTLARTTCEGLTIPASAKAIVGNATVINGSGQTGYLTIYPDGVSAPLAANIVYFPGNVLSNAFTVGLSNDGKFNIFAERTIDMVVDIAGYYSTEISDVNGAGLLLNPLSRPLRILDTRASQGNCDNVAAPITGDTSIAAPGRLTCESLTIPNTAQTVLGNVTIINLSGQTGFLTMYPDGQSLPVTANLVYFPGKVLSNAFVVGLNGTDGQYRIYAERTLEAIVDVSGYFAP